MKKCLICGRAFEPYYCQIDKQKTCSKECRLIYQNQYRRFLRRHSEAYRQKEAARSRLRARENRKDIYCKLCGKLIESEAIGRRPEMHDECVYEDCIKTFKEKGTVTHVQEQRLYARGYTVREFYEEFKLKSYKPVEWDKVGVDFITLR